MLNYFSCGLCNLEVVVLAILLFFVLFGQIFHEKAIKQINSNYGDINGYFLKDHQSLQSDQINLLIHTLFIASLMI